MDMAKSLSPLARVDADWDAFASKMRLDTYRLQLKVNEIGRQMRKARAQRQLENEALHRVKPYPKWMNM